MNLVRWKLAVISQQITGAQVTCLPALRSLPLLIAPWGLACSSSSPVPPSKQQEFVHCLVKHFCSCCLYEKPSEELLRNWAGGLLFGGQLVMQLEYFRTSDCKLSGALTRYLFASHLPSPILEELVEVSNFFFFFK